MRSNGTFEGKGGKAAGTQEKKQECDPGSRPGKLAVISLGPGNPDYMAPRAIQSLMDADVVVGYRTYVELIDPALLEGKETLSTGMTGEIQRCRMAIDRALEGKNTVVVSSGDAGIYGMAGLVLELMEEQDLLNTVEVEIVPGIPALTAAASLLGAPLMHDFAVISLSDLLTPWEVIRSRVESAVKTDFVLVIYNPRSRKRDWQLGEIRDLIMAYRSEDTPVGIVRNAMREGQSAQVTDLAHLDVTGVDMFCILVVGNSSTRVLQGKMVTPRGYEKKYGKKAGS